MISNFILGSITDGVIDSVEKLKIVTSEGTKETYKVVDNIEEIIKITQNVKSETENLSTISEKLDEKVN